ncbi:MAG: hypothetical protein GC205_10145 [Bacteroidetes bacterium]|nr:hypothetical protein [Bacteroidota bacterium]
MNRACSIAWIAVCCFAFAPKSPLVAQALRPESVAHTECGTELTEVDLIWLRALQQDTAFQKQTHSASQRGGVQYVRVQAHLVGRENYTGYYRIQSLLESFCRLNAQFAETGFYFFLEYPLKTYEDDRWHNQTFSDGIGMIVLNNEDGALNVYYVGSIESGTIAGYFSPGADGVVMANSASAPSGNTLAHEFGHFFSLPHTFFRWEGGESPPPSLIERVDGSNCSSAGDGFCDTPPDYAYYRWSCPSVGPFVDPNGVSFLVTDSFYMSYAGNECLKHFSPLQSAAMRANLNGQRPELISSIVPNFPNGYDSVVLGEPINGAVNVPPRGQRFTWSEVPGAVAYHVAIAYTTLFTAIAEESVVTGTSFTSLRLKPDRTFYWRVKPIFEGNTCEPSSAYYQFRTGEAGTPVSGIDPVQAADWTAVLHPNPVRAGSVITLEYTAYESAARTWQLRAMDGRIVSSGALPNPELGIPQTVVLDAPAQPGLYVLLVSGADGTVWRRKVVIG